ncbi:MAG: hypothetical protein V9E94_15280 [Microthrixaceae bacterium]
MDGTLALIGGREFTEGCTFDAALVDDASEVLLIPAALAYENPSAAIDRAVEWFSPLESQCAHSTSTGVPTPWTRPWPTWLAARVPST